MTKPKPINLGPWPAGMNNIAPDYALPTSKYGRTIAVRNAVNVDVDDTGLLTRRNGFVKVYAGANTCAGFSCSIGTYFVEGSLLKKLNADNTAATLFTSVTGDEVTYEEFNGVVYFSDGVVTKKIHADNSVTEWGMDAPAAPVLSGIAGVFGPGAYIGAITFVDAAGAESGASEFRSVTLAENAGVKFDSLPTSADPQVTKVRLYLSAPNGTTLYLAGEVAIGTLSYSISAGRYDNGQPLSLQFVSKPPPGRIVRHFRGRMYIADGKTIWYTEPGALDHVRLADNFYQFPDDVAVMEPVLGGVWIVADKTYFYPGTGPDDFTQQSLLDYGALYGTAKRVPNSNDVMWYSDRGAVIATADGRIKNLQEENVAAEAGSSGAALIRESNGVRQFIASVKNPVVSPLAAQSFLEMEVIRKS